MNLFINKYFLVCKQGVALLYLHLYQRLDQRKSDRFLLKAKYYIDGASERQKSRAGAVAFLGGEAGPLAVAAVVYHLIGQGDKSRDFIARLTYQLCLI